MRFAFVLGAGLATVLAAAGLSRKIRVAVWQCEGIRPCHPRNTNHQPKTNEVCGRAEAANERDCRNSGGIKIADLEYPLIMRFLSDKDVTIRIGNKDKRFREYDGCYERKDGRLLVVNG